MWRQKRKSEQKIGRKAWDNLWHHNWPRCLLNDAREEKIGMAQKRSQKSMMVMKLIGEVQQHEDDNVIYIV